MSKYKVQVAVTYFHTIEVDADSVEEAEATAFDLFDVDEAYPGDGEIRWTTCGDDEGESN